MKKGAGEKGVFETQPMDQIGKFNVYAADDADLSVFPPSGTSFVVLISLRSRSFGYENLRRAFAFVMRFSDCCLISVVDSPYRWNDFAQASASAPAEIMSEIERLSAEVWRRIDNVAIRFPNLCLEKKTWAQLSAATPEWMKRECEDAYKKKSLFWEQVNAATLTAIENKRSVATLDIAALFLVEELPVLCWLYYGSPTKYIDLYPGRPFAFFRVLEQGGFKEELPGITALASHRAKLIHVDISHEVLAPAPNLILA